MLYTGDVIADYLLNVHGTATCSVIANLSGDGREISRGGYFMDRVDGISEWFYAR